MLARTFGSWIWDMRTDEEEWSDGQYLLFGYRPREIRPTYETFKSALHPEDRPRVLSAVSATIQKGTTYRVPCRIIRRPGDVVHVVCAGDVVRDSNGEPVRMAGTVVPVRRREGVIAVSSDLHAAVRQVAAVSGMSFERIAELAIQAKYRKTT